MKKNEFEIKYNVIDGAVDIAEDRMVIELTEAQIGAIVDDLGIVEDDTDESEILHRDEALEDISDIILEDARKKYGDKVKGELYARCDVKKLMAQLKEWKERIAK